MAYSMSNGDKLIANMTRHEYKEYVEQGIFPDRLKPLARKLGISYPERSMPPVTVEEANEEIAAMIAAGAETE